MRPNLSSTWAQGASPSSDENDRLAQILDEYLRCLERGEPVTTEALLARHPDLAERLRGYLSGLELIQNAVAQSPLQSVSICRGDHGLELRGQLGDFRLVREIGRGGMGIVYEGVQVSLGRRVALKVLPFASAIDEKQITRFKNEAQAAAQVDHPNIVPVFAIGQDQGIHYFAMQLIGGRSLGQLLHELRTATGHAGFGPTASQRSIGSAATLNHIRGVAQIGMQAAGALHAVHEIGVVHRDVKPSNLLLDLQGKLWVTDFGLARCQSSNHPTETGQVLGTKRYMSPEQALGQTALVDHRTDVYSLGITLYELATLRHPYEASNADDTLHDLQAHHLGLGRRLRHWNRSIPADFENIVLKAMAETRDERYATARELAEDLERFLAGEPILARRPSLSARFGKWTRRHKRAMAAAAGVGLLAVTGLVASLIVIAGERAEKDAAWRVATRNHLRAEQSFTQAQANFRQTREMLDRFGARVAERLEKVPGAETVRKELLSEMLPYYRRFAEQSAEDPTVQADMAMTFSNIAYLSDQLGLQPDAEQAYLDAAEMLEQLLSTDPANAEHQRNLALCHNNLGQLLQRRGDLTAARQRLEKALAIQQRLVEDAPVSDEYRTDLATTQSNLGLLASHSNNRRGAAERYQAAIAIQESILRARPDDETNLNNLAASYNNLSALYPAEPNVAEKWQQQALTLQLELVRKHPQQHSYQSDLALSYNNLGAIHSRQSRWDEAKKCFLDAITLQTRLVESAPLVTAYRRDLSVSFNNLGMAQSSGQDLAEAEKSFEKALAIQSALADSRPHDLSLQSGIAGIYNNLGMVRQQQGRLKEACAAFQRAIASQQHAFRRAPEVRYFRESLSKHYFNYAEVLRKLGRPIDAASAAIERRQLWSDNPARLLLVAQELAATCKQIPPGPMQSRYLAETMSTLQAARAAGLNSFPDLTASPFDVLNREEAKALVRADAALLSGNSTATAKAKLE